jgi:hypothetical protein
VKKRFPLSAVLLALVLTLPTVPALVQSEGSEGRSMGDIIADALEDLARAINPDEPIDPAAPIDPGVPAGPDSGGPSVPAGPTGPEIEELSEADGDGGFSEIQLLPDPLPRAGIWKVVNQPGRMTCTGIGSLPLKRSVQNTRIAVREDGRVLRGPRLVPGQRGRINLTWQPETEAYTGVIRVAAPGGAAHIRFYLRVVSPTRMKSEMVATVTVNAQGVSGRCGGTREITLTHRGN